LPPLELRKGLILGAKDHVNDLVKSGQSGHRGSDGSILEDRLNRYGSWSVFRGEDIVYRSRKAREDVIALIIDDGVKSRRSPQEHIQVRLSRHSVSPEPVCKIANHVRDHLAGGFADKGTSGQRRRQHKRY